MMKTILLVDDEPDLVHLVKQTLELKGGYRVFAALSGEEALQILRKEEPDLIVVDVMMPEMSGLDLCREIAKQGLAPGVPVMLLTALSDLAYRSDQILGRYNVAVCMYKPFETATLLENVRLAMCPV